MSEAYKIFMQLQEKEKQAQQYKSYEREDLIDEIINLQQENEQLQDRINKAVELVEEIKLHYQNHPTMIPSVKINKLEDLLKGDKE